MRAAGAAAPASGDASVGAAQRLGQRLGQHSPKNDTHVGQHAALTCSSTAAHPPDADLDTVTAHLRVLDCSCKPLRSLRPDAAFPALLEELHLSGCSLDALPPGIARLCKLKKIFAGANR